MLLKKRNFSVLAAVLSVTLLSLQSSHARDPSWPVEILETMDMQRVAVFPKLGDILDSPAWHPGQSPAPLGIDEAIELASRFETETGHMAHAEVDEIKLLPIKDRRADGRWYYLAKVVDRDEASTKPRFVAILMNGTPAPAIVEPVSVR